MEDFSFELEKNIENLMNKTGTELEQAIENLRKQNLFNKASALKSRIIEEGRCPKCTLKTPCEHYSSPSDFRLNMTNMSELVLHTSTPKSEISNQFSITPTSSKAKVRYRGRKANSPNLIRNSNELEKLKLMEKLEKYKEDKLQKQIQYIEELKRFQEIEQEKTKQIEKKKEIYTLKQKEKIMAYKQNLKQRIHELEQQKINYSLQEKINSQNLKKTQEEKKKKILEHKSKKKLLENIVFMQLESAGTPKLNRKKYKFKSLKDGKNHV
jgi:hypothetical protein